MPPPATSRAGRALAAALAGAAAGCSLVAPGRFVAERARPPDEVARAAAAGTAGPPPVVAPAPAPSPPAQVPRSLADLVDLALQRDPTTRATWFDARAAAAAAGSERNLYLPTIGATAGLTRQRIAAVPGRSPFVSTFGGPTATFSWPLLDLGTRAALVDSADRLALAAQLAENAAVQDLVSRVTQLYYQLLGARALVEAENAAVRQAKTSLDAADERHRAGVATVADVLQARTALSQVQLTLQQQEGQQLILRGALASAAGLSPVTELDVGALPAAVKITETLPDVEALLEEAAARNPDLGRARAQSDAAAARARAAAVAYLPVLSLDAGFSWAFYISPGLPSQTAWNIGLTVRVPLFEGLAPVYDALSARAAADAARARAEAAAQQVALEVWTDWQALRTASRRVDTAKDLLASARASADVAQGRYREGLGSILDLLTAQSALESARAEDVRARTDYLVALSLLYRATGRLELPAEGSRGGATP